MPSYYDGTYHNFGFHEILEESHVRVKSENGSRITYYCPFCGDKKGKGDASLTKNVFHCYKCNADGFLFELYARVMDISVGDAKRYFEQKYDFGMNCDNSNQVKRPKLIKYEEKPLNIASDEHLHRAYKMYLDMLSLDEVHKQNLISRGLSEESISAMGFKSVPVVGGSYYPRKIAERDEKVLEGVTGFYKDEDGAWQIKKHGTGFYIPTRNLKGEIVSMQVRNDYGDLRYYTFSSSQELGGADMSSQMHFVGVDISKPVSALYLTEGALKADVAHHLSGKPFASIPGVGNFKALKQGLQSMRDCDAFKDTIIVLATDMDESENVAVRKNVAKLKSIISAYGFVLKKISWDPTYKGIDDYLLSLRTPQSAEGK